MEQVETVMLRELGDKMMVTMIMDLGTWMSMFRKMLPDGLVQMRLSNFIHSFPNLQPSGAVTMGGGLTNSKGEASQRNYSANQRAGILGRKRKLDQDFVDNKRWRESADFGVIDSH